MVDFVEQRCWEFINTCQTKEKSDALWSSEIETRWNKFLVWYNEIVENSATIHLTNLFQINVCVPILILYINI